MTSRPRMQRRHHGDVLVRADLAGTALFVVTAALAATTFTTATQWIGAVTALVLFAIGVFTFLWSYWNAVQRSRADEISVTQLYLLMGPAIPARVRRTMNLALTVQFVTALATALARPNGPDGNPGSSLAVGFLVPMFGFGLNGLWAAFHGEFEPRVDPDAASPTPSSSGSADDEGAPAGGGDAVDDEDLDESGEVHHAEGLTREPADDDDEAVRASSSAPTRTGSVAEAHRELGQNADHG